MLYGPLANGATSIMVNQSSVMNMVQSLISTFIIIFSSKVRLSIQMNHDFGQSWKNTK